MIAESHITTHQEIESLLIVGSNPQEPKQFQGVSTGTSLRFEDKPWQDNLTAPQTLMTLKSRLTFSDIWTDQCTTMISQTWFWSDSSRVKILTDIPVQLLQVVWFEPELNKTCMS